MRCGAVITYKERRSQAGTRMAIDKPATVTWYATGDLGIYSSQPTLADYLAKPNTEICDGNIIATVEADDELYMGGSNAILSISYKCDKCANDFFIELPQTGEELSAMLTAHIATLDATKLRAAKREQELSTRAQQEAWRLEALASLKERQEAGRIAKSRLAPKKPKG